MELKEILPLIFSVASFIGVLGTIIYQVSTYRTTKKTSALQRLDTSYFNMLGLQQQITNELKSPDDDITVKGRALFEYLYLKYEKKNKKPINKSSIIENVCGSDSKCGKDSMMSEIYFKGLEGYDQSDLPTVFDHYFRHLYRIIKYIDDPQHTFLKKEERYNYAANLRGTLSKYELVWLYYNCLAGPGFEKFKPLVEKYALLKNIRVELLSTSKEFRLYAGTTTPRPIQDIEGYNDFDFYLTDDKKQKDKYYLGAFYSEKELEVKKRELREKRAAFNAWVARQPNEPVPEPERAPGQD